MRACELGWILSSKNVATWPISCLEIQAAHWRCHVRYTHDRRLRDVPSQAARRRCTLTALVTRYTTPRPYGGGDGDSGGRTGSASDGEDCALVSSRTPDLKLTRLEFV